MEPRNHFRAQKKGQNARQAMMISGLSTIYRNNTSTHFIQTKQHTEPRIYILDVTLEEMCARYSDIHKIIERGRLRPKGTELFFVDKKMEHFVVSQDGIFEIRANDATRQQNLHERIPVDGQVRTMEIIKAATAGSVSVSVPVLVDESYYEIIPVDDKTISTYHTVVRHVKKVVKTHPKSMTAFVFLLNETETDVLDFYITTENGVIPQSDILTRTCISDIISFLDHFKLCS
jgi:hypothetical protein